jgi:hypothetical protein
MPDGKDITAVTVDSEMTSGPRIVHVANYYREYDNNSTYEIFHHFDAEYMLVVAEYLVTFSVRDCGVNFKPLSGFYEVDFAQPFTQRVDVVQVQ